MTTTVPPRDNSEGEHPEAVASEAAPAEAAAAEAAAPEVREGLEDVQVEEPRPSQPERPAIPASAFAEPGVTSPSRDSFDLFRQGPDSSRPEPVTQPMSILRQEGASSSTPATASTSASADAHERTLTRRELRAMLQAQEANAQANLPAASGDPVFPVTFTSGPEAEAAANDSAKAANEAPSASAAETDANAAAGAPASATEKSAWPLAPLTPSSAPAASRSGQSETTVTQSATSPFAAFGSSAAKAAADETSSDAAAVPAAKKDSEDTAAQERRPFTPPTGHWSTAAELEDQSQPITSRNVAQSTAATTTSALILPVIPQPSTNAPLTSTGEILVTGSIDLPRGMGATGAHPDRIDSSDLDRLLDGEENEFNTSEVQPVRASRAISTHTSTRGVIAPPKKRGNTLPVVLMVTAGVLAVGVIGLLVAAYVLKVF
ncbi:hypothetical protein [Leifsonia sp. fls2-241-R2A-40a]|uniref:hypothetical protein n=1 Tax=Leifsonia sp. fls2-241-R2A-40a TaxID=3040290 RepID=UPI00254EFFA6|nr:hypothetical protein [Leifsonia sp. fls2-241-R2A-40a]